MIVNQLKPVYRQAGIKYLNQWEKIIGMSDSQGSSTDFQYFPDSIVRLRKNYPFFS